MNTKYLKDLQNRAEAGDPSKQAELGKMYYKGEGVPRHYETATDWFLKAAEQNFVEAEFYLGKMYFEDKVVQDKNSEEIKQRKAKHWLKQSADIHGFADAQLYLGKKLEENGDHVGAYKWYSLATAQGSEDARVNLDVLEKCMSRKDVTEAQKDAASWHWRDEHAVS
ncbi:MAG: tetratricopeptide repeat protein [Gammaproteobacteria bacterium]|nr:tetratricopeptide repeat protein [Gammaproteobacteria bacterium]